jgi:hypothetical protein
MSVVASLAISDPMDAPIRPGALLQPDRNVPLKADVGKGSRGLFALNKEKIMAALRRRIGEHPLIGGFLGAFLFGGVAVFLDTADWFVVTMAMLGFLLAAAVILTLAGKRGHHEEINEAISHGRGEAERLRLGRFF